MCSGVAKFLSGQVTICPKIPGDHQAQKHWRHEAREEMLILSEITTMTTPFIRQPASRHRMWPHQ